MGLPFLSHKWIPLPVVRHEFLQAALAESQTYYR
jgi:hypothetical protein